MKAILVIDMPEDCWDCHLPDKLVNCKGKPSRCPLKPMPEKINEKVIDFVPRGYWSSDVYEAKGWNDCIEEIENG